jgi:hypothetical protein
MAGPIYKLWMFKYTEAWYQLSEEEQQDVLAKLQAAYEKVGGTQSIAYISRWSAERWHAFGLDEFPDIEAVLSFHELLDEHDHFRYVESVSMLGTKWEPW